MSEALLTLEKVSASYGGPDIVRNVSLSVDSGEVVTVLGFNGAGKSTLLKAITGLVRVTSGRVAVDGRDLAGVKVHQRVAMGVTQIPQGRRLFGYSTGYENLKLGAYTRRDRQQVDRDIERFVERWPIARRVLHRKAHLMSGGEQQVIAFGRALMSRPRVLLLDEPSMGLAPILVNDLFEMMKVTITEANEEGQGMAVLLIEQNVRSALQVANRVYVLVAGEVVHTADARAIPPEEVVALYLGAQMRRSRHWIKP